jgi:adenylosuccinate lyase
VKGFFGFLASLCSPGLLHFSSVQELSPLDGRYRSKTEALRPFFSEEALMRARVEVEIRYFIALSHERGIRDLRRLKARHVRALEGIVQRFNLKEALAIQAMERKTNHDVKAVEYYLRGKFERIGLKSATPFLHFALTSEDTNNLAYGLLIHRGLRTAILPELRHLRQVLVGMGRRYRRAQMLS